MHTNIRTLSLVALSVAGLAATPKNAHAVDWDYCPGDCPAPEVTAEVVQGRDGSCSVALTMVTPASMMFQSDGGYDAIAFTDLPALEDAYDVGGLEPWQIQFDYDSDDLLVPENEYDVINPDDDAYDPAYSAFGSVVVQTVEIEASAGESGSAYSLGFAYEDILNFPSTPLPVGEILASDDWFCPLPAWDGGHELNVTVTPNGSNATCTVDVELRATGVNESAADQDEFDIMFVEDGAISFVEDEGQYLDVVGGMYIYGESFTVEDGASGSVEAFFADMDTNTPVTELLDATDWSCEACTTLVTDLNGDGLVNVADLLIFIQSYGTTDATCDFDGNGVVGSNDLTFLFSQFGMTSC